MKRKSFRRVAGGTGLILALLLQSACADRPDTTDSGPVPDDKPAEDTASVEASEAGAAEVASQLNDTGVVFAGNHPRTVNQDCKGVIDPDDEWVMDETFDTLEFSGQDCEYGRDATHPDNSDGHAGFSLVKLDAQGQSLPADAEQWRCVHDNVTGLTWEAKEPADEKVGNAGLHDADDKFSFYSTDSNANGGEIGNWNKDWKDCAGYREGAPITFCNSQSFAERINAAGLCGYQDWRLPTFNELLGITNYVRTTPTAEMTFFPHTQAAEYWTSSILAGEGKLARYIHFRFGVSGIGYRTDSYHIRLVRGADSAATVKTDQ